MLSEQGAHKIAALCSRTTPMCTQGGVKVFDGFSCSVDYDDLPAAVQDMWFENAAPSARDVREASRIRLTFALGKGGSVTVSCGSSIASTAERRRVDAVSWVVIVLCLITWTSCYAATAWYVKETASMRCRGTS